MRFLDDSDRVAGQELELQHVSTRLEKLSKCINTKKQFFNAYIWEKIHLTLENKYLNDWTQCKRREHPLKSRSSDGRLK